MSDAAPAPHWDPVVEEQHASEILLNALRVGIWLEGNANREMLDAELTSWIHLQVFQSVFPDFAGRVRGAWCPYPMAFGPYRGSPVDRCEDDFERLGEGARAYVEALDKLLGAEVPERAIQAACDHHARFIKIHPFLNGNGRTGRLCVNYFAHRYQLRPITVNRSSMSNYEKALGVYFTEGRLTPLVELWRPPMIPVSTP